MCPRGKGFVPTGESSYDIGGENYKGQNQTGTILQHVSHWGGSTTWVTQT
jgi:hypothetical protein